MMSVKNPYSKTANRFACKDMQLNFYIQIFLRQDSRLSVEYRSDMA